MNCGVRPRYSRDAGAKLADSEVSGRRRSEERELVFDEGEDGLLLGVLLGGCCGGGGCGAWNVIGCGRMRIRCARREREPYCTHRYIYNEIVS